MGIKKWKKDVSELSEEINQFLIEHKIDNILTDLISGNINKSEAIEKILSLKSKVEYQCMSCEVMIPENQQFVFCEDCCS